MTRRAGMVKASLAWGFPRACYEEHERISLFLDRETHPSPAALDGMRLGIENVLIEVKFVGRREEKKRKRYFMVSARKKLSISSRCVFFSTSESAAYAVSVRQYFTRLSKNVRPISR